MAQLDRHSDRTGTRGALAVLPEKNGRLVWRLTGLSLKLFACLFVLSGARAETLVVVEARGIGSTAGQQLDSQSRLTLRGGEHVRLIGQNGNQYCLDGPYDGPAKPAIAPAGSQSFFALLAGRPAVAADPLTDCVR